MKKGFVLGYKYYDEVNEALRSGLVGVYSQKQYLYAAMCKLRGWPEDQEIETAFLPSGKNLNYRRFCDESRKSSTQRIVVKDQYGNVLFPIWLAHVNMMPVPGEGEEWWHCWQLATKDKVESHWDDHPDYPTEDWKEEIMDGNTRQSYKQWVASQVEQEREDA